jgi:predicted nucleic acid-binding protein
MAASVIVDASFLAALLNPRETNHEWAARQAREYPPPWNTCEAALSETFFLLGTANEPLLTALLSRGSVRPSFHLDAGVEPILTLMQKYADVPMSFADACLVRMTELLPEPVLLTTDSDFRIYRRHSRRAIPCVLPS